MTTFKHGDFIFYKTNALSGRVIRHFQRRLYGNNWMSVVNHVSFCIEPPDFVRDAVIPKSVIHSNSTVKDREIIAIVRPLFFQGMENTSKQLIIDKIMAKEEKIYGHAYGIPQIVGMLFWTISAEMGIDLHKNPIRSGRICTEDAYMTKLDLEKPFLIRDPVNKRVQDVNCLYPAFLLKMFNDSEYYKVLQFGNKKASTHVLNCDFQF